MGLEISRKQFFRKFVLAPPQEVLGDERRNECILQQVRLGQARKARKSSIIRPPPPLSMSIFQNSEKNHQITGHPGGVRWWKNGLRGLFKEVGLGQVRKAKKVEKVKPFVDLFWTNFRKNGFERTTLSVTFGYLKKTKLGIDQDKYRFLTSIRAQRASI